MNADGKASTIAAASERDNTDTLLQLVMELAQDLRPRESQPARITLDSRLERDLGFDSLSRIELLTRIERRFGATLSEQVFTSVETPRDLLRLLSRGEAHRAPSAVAVEAPVSLEEASAAPDDAQTLVDVLEWHARHHAERPHVYLLDDGGEERAMTYRQLLEGAEAVAAGLQYAGLEPGQTAAIMLPTGREYLLSFFAVLIAGGVPVPIYPPVRLAQIEDHLRRHVGILSNAGARILITVPEARPLARLLKAQVKDLRHVVSVQQLLAARDALARPPLRGEDTAFVQYTSGSTAAPKGVVLTHKNLLSNIRVMGKALHVDSTDIFVSWLPMYHDMGLIGAWLGTLYHATPLVLMSPLTFLTRPSKWLWAIDRHRATLSAGPNFAYELCVRKIEDAEIEGLDLGSWRMAANGAEPVSAETVRAFSERFAPYGFRPEAMYPVYGLAECSVGLTFPPIGRGPVIDRIQREPFVGEGRAIPAAGDEAQALSFVGCGYSLPEHEVRVVDGTGSEIGDRQEGRLQFRGPSATSGYYRNQEATRRLFDGDWLDSGDLAYTVEGEVYLTGRVKDVIIRAGRNIYPQELEEVVGNIAGIRRGCVAVFPAPDPVSGSERVIVVAETRETESQVLANLRARIINVTVDLVGMPPDDVVLAPPYTVLKTSSGKLRRTASRELYAQGKLGKPVRATWWQFARFTWAGMRPQFHRTHRLVADLLYAAYAWTLFALIAPVVWTLAACTPRRTWCWRLVGGAARLALRFTGARLRIDGLQNLAPNEPCVLAVNHASYLDGVVLTAALPRPFTFVAKRELDKHFISRIFLRRLGVQYVERFDKQRGADDARRTARSVREGESLIYFPEGTFMRMPGLLPFRMGAFIAATEAGVPVVPMTIHGTRAKLRADQWLPRRGAISVTISRPIYPRGKDWNAAVALRDAARAEMLRHCGEPDLGGATVAL
jgi:1-acyl-sn-glycerol-3-phosphate acyltransferase